MGLALGGTAGVRLSRHFGLIVSRNTRLRVIRRIPESHGLTGETLGYRGPWGTTYAINLRLYMPNFSAAPWVQLAQHLQTRPPMPWCVLRHMTDAELDAMYHVIRSLGPAGDPAPAYLPRAPEPPPPYGQFPGPPP
jgi:hypothetical protein